MMPMPEHKSSLMRTKILLIDCDEGVRKALSLFFQARGVFIQVAESVELALGCLEKSHYDFILCDYWLPGMTGADFFECIKDRFPPAQNILMMTAGRDIPLAGLFDIAGLSFINKPFSGDDIEFYLFGLLEKRMKKQCGP